MPYANKVDKRTDGSVEVIDVKLNNRKTKKVGDEKSEKNNNFKVANSIPDIVDNKIVSKNKI